MSDNPIIKSITQNLQPITDITLLILKSQLIVEEEINQALQSILPNASALDMGHLSFFQRIQIARALDAYKNLDTILKFAERLNSIRDNLAHQLEPVGVEDAVVSFVTDVAVAIPLKFGPEVPLNLRMAMCVGYICGVLYAFQKATNVLCTNVVNRPQ